jgi:hypothetical protein
MTREEERLESAKFYNDKGMKDPHVHFLRGSEWADSTMIDKACEWLSENFIVSPFDSTKIITHFSSIFDVLDSFRKAMKE